jgi:hypothetical protein
MFCDDRLDTFVEVPVNCCACAAGATQTTGSMNPAAAKKIRAFVATLRVDRRIFS